MCYISPDFADFNLSSVQLIFQPGCTNQTSCADIPIVNDLVLEEDEVFKVHLSTGDPGIIILGTDIATITIINDDSKLLMMTVNYCLFYSMLFAFGGGGTKTTMATLDFPLSGRCSMLNYGHRLKLVRLQTYRFSGTKVGHICDTRSYFALNRRKYITAC